MSEHVYTISGMVIEPSGEVKDWRDVRVEFSDTDDDTACLCTFPHNFMDGLDTEHMRSLALLGAATVLAHQGELQDEYNIIPFCIPQWIRDEINRIVLVDRGA